MYIRSRAKRNQCVKRGRHDANLANHFVNINKRSISIDYYRFLNVIEVFFYGESFKFISFIAIHTWLAVFDFCCVFVLNRCKTFDWRRKIVNRHYLSQLSFLLLLLSSQNNKFSIEIQISFIGHAEISRNVQAVKRAISFSCLLGCSLSSFRTICDETWSSPAFSRVKRSM